MDTSLAGYILNPSANDYGPGRLCDEYHVPAPEINSEDKFAAASATLRALYPILTSKIEANGQEELLRTAAVRKGRRKRDANAQSRYSQPEGTRLFR